MTIRPARREDGPAIGKLFRDADWPDLGVDWTTANVAGWWLVAESAGEVLGAVQVSCAEPWGYLGEIVVHPRARGGVARLARRLYYAAEAVMAQAGCQRVVATARADRPGWRRIIAGWGAVEHRGSVVLVSKEV